MEKSKKEKDIEFLKEFQSTLHNWSVYKMQSSRSKINQMLPRIRRIVSITKTNKYINLSAPLAAGGRPIIKNGNVLDLIFDAPFNTNVLPHVNDAIDGAIGVLSDDDFEYPSVTSKELQETVPYNLKAVRGKKVFIVHGHDESVRNDVELFVRSIGFEPIILFKRADKGDTIIEKIEREAQDVCYAIVIYTACDLGKDKNDADIKPRARQNVVFEHGFMCAHLTRKRVCALLEDGVEQPGDLKGVIYKPLDKGGLWKYEVAREMKACGLDVDLNKLLL